MKIILLKVKSLFLTRNMHITYTYVFGMMPIISGWCQSFQKEITNLILIAVNIKLTFTYEIIKLLIITFQL